MNGKEQESKRTFSDIRLKANIHRIGTTVLNLPLYSFQYLNQTGTYVGVMAQDVLKVEPSAVSVGANGYYMVDYGKLGIAMERIQ
ncbi:MAG: tail fiber domain-containing protein [Aestuariivirga sp.]